VVLGYFRVVRWFTKVFMLFFRFFFKRKNSLKIKFLAKKKKPSFLFLITTIVVEFWFSEDDASLTRGKKTVVANNMSTIPYKIKKI